MEANFCHCRKGGATLSGSCERVMKLIAVVVTPVEHLGGKCIAMVSIVNIALVL